LIHKGLESGNFEPRRRQMGGAGMDHDAFTVEDVNCVDLPKHSEEQPVSILAMFTVWNVIAES
jgi:hypothetical protein